MGRLHRSGGWRFAPVLAGILFLLAFCATSWGADASQPARAVPSSVDAAAKLDTGDTAWMLVSSALVMLMVPGLALFYGGMVRKKNVLGTMMHSMAALGIIGVEWVVIGYAMAFGRDQHGLVGWDPQLLFLNGILPNDVHAGTNTPELIFVMFQGMFAIITPALITGAFAERVKFSSFAVFTLLWGLLIYNPLAHWVWGGGWLAPDLAKDGNFHVGAIDFAGGTVVHISAGFSALVAALYIGKRVGYPNSVLQPNSLVLTLLGAGLLWFGWFGFNGGSAVGINNANFGVAAVAFTTTQIAAAAGGLAWLIAEWMKHGRPTSLGFASGLVAGLVAITQASGYVSPWAAIVIGALAGLVCYGAVVMKGKFGYDDSLDAFGVHGVGGFLGALLTGIFCTLTYNAAGADGAIAHHPEQVWKQFVAAASAAIIAGIGTLILLVIIDKTMGL
ncbi:MAG TPA: ammonium transporter, partial [Phycisphaerae bacterium]|nr:ammonium transporter [Phycisphaerae bacterium]